MDLTVDQISKVLFADPVTVGQFWPLLVLGLEEFGILDVNVEIAAAATISVECPSWRVIAEKHAVQMKQPKLWALQQHYWPSGFYGRGPLQLTHEKNYKAAGDAIGVDLVSDPDKALDPNNAARIFAWYFKTNGVARAAQIHDWPRSRALVNGGNGVDILNGGTTIGLTKYLAAVRALTASLANAQPGT